MHGKATVKGIITVLPAGVALQSKKVVNCINQLKEAKTNKERIFRVIELGKELGILALTPVIFTAKFIVKHWYLILLLLLLLKLPAFNFNPQDEKKPYEQTDPQYEPVTVDDLEEVKNPDFGKVPEPVRNPVIGKVPKPGYNPNPYTPGVNVPVTDTGTGGEIDIKIPDVTQPVDITHTVKNPVVGKVPKPGFNPNPYTPGVNVPVTDTATGGKVDIKLPDVSEPVDIKNPVVQPVHTVKNPVVGKVPKPGLNPNPYTPGVNVPVTDTGTGGKVDIKLPDVTQPVDIAEPVLPIVELTEAEQETFAKITNDFLNYLEKNFHVVIGNWHEDIPIVHSPEEFVKFVEENRPLVHVTVEEAEDFYLKNVMNQGAGLAGYSVIWPEIDSVTKYFATETDLVNYILSGENYELTRAFNNFVNQGGNMSLLQRIANAYNPDTFAEYASKVGLSSTMGTLLFVLYEALQYGFAGPTGGLSLVLPG